MDWHPIRGGGPKENILNLSVDSPTYQPAATQNPTYQPVPVLHSSGHVGPSQHSNRNVGLQEPAPVQYASQQPTSELWMRWSLLNEQSYEEVGGARRTWNHPPQTGFLRCVLPWVPKRFEPGRKAPIFVPAEGIWLGLRCTFHWWEFTFKGAWQRTISGWICHRNNSLSEQRGSEQREALHCLHMEQPERCFMTAPMWLKASLPSLASALGLDAGRDHALMKYEADAVLQISLNTKSVV